METTINHNTPPVVTTTAPVHPNHMANARAKALRIVAFLDANPRLFPNRDADTVSSFGVETWNLANVLMNEDGGPPSEITVSLVVGILAGRSL